MIWPSEELKSWSDFRGRCEALAEKGPSFGAAILFRGHANADWNLKPSLLRLLEDEENEAAVVVDKQSALELEWSARYEFIKEAQFHTARQSDILLPQDPDKQLEWWIVMQHYGAPTRLLDWTTSPYTAAYFAVEGSAKKPGAICFFQPAFLERYNNRTNPGWAYRLRRDEWQGIPRAPLTVIPHPVATYSSARLLAQQGQFTVCNEILGDHGEIIAKALPDTGDTITPLFGRWTIPHDLKPKFRLQLRDMKVTASTLFPGVDGLGRSVAERIRLHVENP